MNILLLNDNGYVNNFGCQATMKALKQIITDAVPDCSLTTIRQDHLAKDYRVLTKQHQSLKHQIKKLLGIGKADIRKKTVQYFPRTANEFPMYAEQWQKGMAGEAGQTFIPLLQQSDLIVHNAELLNYTSSNKVSLRGAFLVWFAKKYLGKRAAMINQTTPAQGSDLIMEGVLEFTCPALDLVTAREPRSQETLKKLGVSSTLIPDPVFTMKPNVSNDSKIKNWDSSIKLKNPYICLSFISVSAAHINPGQSISQPKKVIKALQNSGFQVVLLDAGSSSFKKNNYILAEQTNAVLFQGDYVAFWSLLQDAHAIVSGHYHNIIMAAQLGCPFIAFRSVSHKIESLCELLEWPVTPLNPTCLGLESNIDKILSKLNYITENRPSLSDYLMKKTGQLQQTAVLSKQLIQNLIPLVFNEK